MIDTKIASERLSEAWDDYQNHGCNNSAFEKLHRAVHALLVAINHNNKTPNSSILKTSETNLAALAANERIRK